MGESVGQQPQAFSDWEKNFGDMGDDGVEIRLDSDILLGAHGEGHCPEARQKRRRHVNCRQKRSCSVRAWFGIGARR